MNEEYKSELLKLKYSDEDYKKILKDAKLPFEPSRECKLAFKVVALQLKHDALIDFLINNAREM